MDLHLLGAGGIFSAADAARHGIDRHALSRLCSDGRLVRLSRGWYSVVDGERPKGEDLHRLTSLALGRQFRARAVISHHSLLVCRKLPTFRADLSTVHLTSAVDDAAAGGVPGRGRRSVTVRRPGLAIHRQVAGIRLSAPAAHDGRPAAIPLALAIVQAGLVAGAESALVPADAALRAGPSRLPSSPTPWPASGGTPASGRFGAQSRTPTAATSLPARPVRHSSSVRSASSSTPSTRSATRAGSTGPTSASGGPASSSSSTAR